MSTLVLDPKYLDSTYAELGQMDIQLDDDPLPFGPKRLNSKIAESRRMLSRCERLFVQASQYLSQAKRELRVESLSLDLAKKHLLANDPLVRAERSVSDRDAAATMQLRVQVNEVNRLEQLAQDLDDLLTVIKAKRSDLRDIQGRLRDQIRLCQNEIGLGDRWGSQVPGARNLDDGLPTAADVQEINALIANLGKDGEVHLEADSTPEEEVDENAVRASLVLGLKADPSPPVLDQTKAPTVAPPELPTPEALPPEEEDVSDLFPDSAGPSGSNFPTALAGSASTTDVEKFLSCKDFPPPATRRQQEEQDSFDIDDILSHFSG